jgi:alkanesulfonate monooxygenase SsuD/methylene tetrahydromethanopterin reductase-like flavin-dependent oxidoreductase (luciferase family)
VLGVGVGDPRDPTYQVLGEETALRTRAAMLDEALEVIDGLWRGEPLEHRGRHYRLDRLALRLTPLQRPRVPIWVGGLWPRRGPVERAARWDGAMLGWKDAPDGREVEMTPADVRALVAAICRLRPEGVRGFDFVMGGRGRRPDEAAERAWLHEIEAAGATWWMEWVPPGPASEMRETVRRGPLLAPGRYGRA